MLCLARGRCCAGFQGHFGVEAWRSACSRCGDFVWSGGNVEKSSDCVFFMEVGRGRGGGFVTVFQFEAAMQRCWASASSGVVSFLRRRTRIKFVNGLTGLNEAFRHSWYQSEEVEMADRRDWGGGGEEPEESTQHMIERIWESLTDIRMRMDQQALVPPVPPVAGVPVAPVPPLPRVEVPYVAPVPPLPAMAVEEPVMQVEKFLRLQPPTYTRGPNPDTVEH
ncbi:hypothetical protein Taro_046585 [Colocasia esculenta]|uniref:Uncharacterized protein n=1 Tax=Colocasia esculenta TaxID=4460 RepID=A0A843WU51_COLES|nr:hypothetical protein [Colocasia esculenta]